MDTPNGWGLSNDSLERIRLLEHLADNGVYPEITSLPDWARELGSDAYFNARRNIADFKARGMLEIGETGAMPSASLNTAGLDEVNRLREQRASRRARTSGIRDALLYWIDEEAAKGQPAPLFDEFVDTSFGMWFGEPFGDREVENGLEWLEANAYIAAAARTDEHGVVRPRMLPKGQAVVDRDGSVSEDLAFTGPVPVSQVTNHFGAHSQVQQGNAYASMTVTNQVAQSGNDP